MVAHGLEMGGPLVVTDGTTLLGADDKAGAAILTELARVLVDGTVPHARIALAWTYDEEIGRGTEGAASEGYQPRSGRPKKPASVATDMAVAVALPCSE